MTEEKTDRADELENQLKTASQQYDKLIDQRLEHKISDIEYYEQMKLYEPTLNIKNQIEKLSNRYGRHKNVNATFCL